MKKLFKEFKDFAIKGNAVDLAIGVVIGAAFGKIVTSIVNDLVMPLVGMLLGGVDFQSWLIELPRLFKQPDPIYLNLGIFINTVIEFIIIALAIFFIVKLISRFKKKEEATKEAAPSGPSREEKLLSEIRDILKDRVL